jgi:uncharacterized protein (DUF1810 family)
LESKLESLISQLPPGEATVSVQVHPDDSGKVKVLIGEHLKEATPVDLPSSTQPPPSHNDTRAHDDRNGVKDNHAEAERSTPNEVSKQEGEALLCTFRDQLLPSLPLLHLPSEVTFHDLCSSHPFLVQAILAVTIPTLARKRALGDKFKQDIGHAMIAKGRSNLDILLALLVFTAWSFDHFLRQSASLLRYMQMAISVVVELGLKQTKAKKPSPDALFPTIAALDHAVAGQRTPLGTLEVERAVLACWLLSATIAAYSGQADAMQWTLCTDVYLTAIEDKQECTSDTLFTTQIRMQLFARRLSDLPDTSPAARTLPELLHLKTIQSDFAQYRSSLLAAMQQNQVVQIFAAYIDMLISDTAYPSRASNVMMPIDELHSIPNGLTPLVCCWSSIRSIKTFFAVFAKLPPAVVRGLAFPVWAQALRCVTTLFSLSTRTDTALDVVAVRKTVDLENVLENLVELTSSTSIIAGETNELDLFARLSSILAISLGRVRIRFAAIASEAHRKQTVAGATSHSNCMTAETLHPMEMGNELWMGNIFGLTM